MSLSATGRQNLRLFGEQLAAELTKIDGQTWTLEGEQNYETIKLVAPNDETLYVQATTNGTGKDRYVGKEWPDRLSVSGGYHRDYRSHQHTYGSDADKDPEAGIAFSKGAERIAKEIAVRVLPGYRSLYAQLRQRKADSDGYYERKHNAAEPLRVLIGGKYPANQSSDPQPPSAFSFGSYGGIHGSVSVSVSAKGHAYAVDSGHNVDLEIEDLSPEQARQVLELLKTFGIRERA